jgi:hypothetical protein
MRDRQEYGEQPGGPHFEHVHLKLTDVYERCYVLDPGKSWELQRRNQRQAMRRALGRLERQDLVTALALGWCIVGKGGGDFLEWQGGGKRKREPGDWNPRGWPTPNWRLVTLSAEGITMATLLEKENS